MMKGVKFVVKPKIFTIDLHSYQYTDSLQNDKSKIKKILLILYSHQYSYRQEWVCPIFREQIQSVRNAIYYNQQQSSQNLHLMIKSIRLRNPQKPFIVQQLIYNHREQPIDSISNSEVSFLKMSQTASQRNKIIQDYQIFAKMQASISRIENKSKLKLSEVQNKLQNMHKTQNLKKNPKKNSKIPLSREILEENKQNLKVTYRQIPRQSRWQEQICETVNFEMDQNRNYVKDIPKKQQNSIIIINPCDTRQAQLLQQSRKLQIIADEGSNIKKIKKEVKVNHLRFNSLMHKGSGQLYSKKKQNPRIRRHSSTHDYRQKQFYNQQRITTRIRGKVYEQILSMYSTAKLLSMEKINK